MEGDHRHQKKAGVSDEGKTQETETPQRQPLSGSASIPDVAPEPRETFIPRLQQWWQYIDLGIGVERRRKLDKVTEAITRQMESRVEFRSSSTRENMCLIQTPILFATFTLRALSFYENDEDFDDKVPQISSEIVDEVIHFSELVAMFSDTKMSMPCKNCPCKACKRTE